MKKLLIITILLLASYFAEAQGIPYEQNLRYCHAIQIFQEGSVDILTSNDRLIISKSFLMLSKKKTDIYIWLKGKLKSNYSENDFIGDDEENKSFLILRQEHYEELGGTSKEKGILTIYKMKFTVENQFYRVGILDITFSEVKNKGGKRKVGKERKFESILRKKKPNCEVIKCIDKSIASELSKQTVISRIY